MKFTLDWLQEYVDTEGYTPAEIADQLTMLGLEVDSVTEMYEELAPLKTATIVAIDKHPDADKLRVCEVAVGEETLTIVCGAPNARKGLATVVALPGTTLPGGIKIKKSKVRGVASSGMLCSERELGLSDSHTGIMELPDDTVHGQSFIEAMGLKDIQIEVDLTPNRPDCASVIGVAREVAGFVRKPLTLPVESYEIPGSSSEFRVDVESSELCPRYAARLIKDIKIGPSPWWLRKRLLSIGLRPINNVVDITNLVMMEYGQPLHAFDFKNVAGGRIVVRNPHQDELKFITLDGVERSLDPQMLMICDNDKPVAVAGVMGGMNSEVSDSTTEVLLESACFNSVSVRKTARQLNLSTDASYRFERGVDPGGCVTAMERAVQLLCEVAGGTYDERGVDVYGGKRPINSQTLRISRTSDLIGMELSYDSIADVLQSIGMRCIPKDEDTLWVNPPTFRVDIEREADLVEEVARLIGYNNVPTALPAVNMSFPEQSQERKLRIQTSRLLTRIGFNEAINYSFVSEKHPDLMALAPEDMRRKSVAILNPLSEDQAVMRTMLIPGLLENVKRNINFQKSAIKLFEIGRVFLESDEDDILPIEQTRLTGVLSGNRHGDNAPLYFKAEQSDFYDVKGAIEFLLRELRLMGVEQKDALSFSLPDSESVEPYTVAQQTLDISAGKHVIGTFGLLRPEIAKGFGIKQSVYYFDIDFDQLSAISAAPKDFSSLPVFPSVKRDLALVVPEHVSAGELLGLVENSKQKLIEHSEIFDIYQGDKIKEGYKSVAISITYRSATKTLTEKNVEKVHQKILTMLSKNFDASLRDE